MVALALRVVGRAIFGDDLARAGAVLDAAFPVLNCHTFRRAMVAAGRARVLADPEQPQGRAPDRRSTRSSTS